MFMKNILTLTLFLVLASNIVANTSELDKFNKLVNQYNDYSSSYNEKINSFNKLINRINQINSSNYIK